MTNQSPITPPPQLVEKWNNLPLPTQDIIVIAWRHGADQELEACIEELCLLWDKEEIVTLDDMLKHLRAARRLKPQSLKKQALKELNLTEDPNGAELSSTQVELIRRALEQLPDEQ